MTINDQSDNGEIKHYGNAGYIDIKECAKHSYYEYGTSMILNITDGHVVLTEDAVVNKEIHLSSKDNTYDGDILLTFESSNVPTITRDPLTLTDGKLASAVLVCEVTTTSNDSTEYVWLVGDGTTENQNAVVTTEKMVPSTDTPLTGTDDAKEVATYIANLLNEDKTVHETGSKLTEEEISNASDGKYVKVTDEAGNVTLTSIMDIASTVNGGNRDAYHGCTIELLSNINLTTTEWAPIGNSKDAVFGGCKLFDGNGYTISGMSYKNTQVYTNSYGTTAEPCGLIGWLDGTIEFTDLTIDAQIDSTYTAEDGTKKANGSIGAFIGTMYAYYEDIDYVSFSNCTVKGSITGGDKVAGFIGVSYVSGTSSVEYFRSNLSNDSQKLAFVGKTSLSDYETDAKKAISDAKDKGCYNQTVEVAEKVLLNRAVSAKIDSFGCKKINFDNCVNNASITGKGRVGGFVGAVGCPVTITNSTNNGQITNSATAEDSGTGTAGFIGCQNQSNSLISIKNSSNTKTVKSSNGHNSNYLGVTQNAQSAVADKEYSYLVVDGNKVKFAKKVSDSCAYFAE